MENLIDSFVDFTKNYVDSPIEFVEAAGYSLISAVMGEFLTSEWLPSLTRRPNLWIVLSSIPGRMRRSSLNAIYDPIYREGKKVVLRERAENEEELERLVELSKIEEGSPEGVIDHIEYTGFDAYHYESSEFGIILKKIMAQGWQYGVGKVISKLVYGEGGTVYLSRRSDKKSLRILRSGLYCDGFLGLQEFYLYITEEMIRQGLIRRFFIIYVPKNPRREVCEENHRSDAAKINSSHMASKSPRENQ